MCGMNVHKHVQGGETSARGEPVEAFASWRESKAGIRRECENGDRGQEGMTGQM